MTAVSVVLPTRNMARTLGAALESACSQSPDLVVVVDDASEDDTPAVVQAAMAKHPCIEYVRHPHKAPCHVAALREVHERLPPGHVIGLAADDVLCPNLVAAVRTSMTYPQLFTHYDCVGPDGETWGVRHPYMEPTYVQGGDMRHRLRHQQPTETGIGSSLRTEVLRWLWDLGWHGLGPHADSIGAAAAAYVYGAVYWPIIGASVAWNPDGYGNRTAREDRDGWARTCRAFLARAGVDGDTAEILVRRRCYG